MHDIQKHVIRHLSLATGLKYSDLKPSATEGNLFTYHLKKLVKEKLIVCKEGKYYLTALGKRFVDGLSFGTFSQRIQPKIVTILVLERAGKYLLYRRNRSPFKGMLGFPYGKIHLEERLVEAANRELLEKTGLSAAIKHKGDVYLSVHDEEELVAHMLCHVFYGKSMKGELSGDCFWVDKKQLPVKELIPGVTQIISLLEKSKNHFFAEYFLNVTEIDPL